MHERIVRRARSLTLVGALISVALSASGHARQQQPAAEASRWIFFAQEQDLRELIFACSRALGMPVDFNPAEVSGTVTIHVPSGTTSRGLWELTNQALASRGLTSVQSPGSDSLVIVPLANAPGLARLEEGGLASARAGFVKALVTVKHEPVESVGDAVKLVLSKFGTITSFKDTRALLVADLKPNVEQALRVVSVLESAAESLVVEEVRLRETSPIALTALIERITNAKKAVLGDTSRGSVLANPDGRSVLIIAPTDEQQTWRELVTRFDKAEPVRTQNYMPRRFGLQETAKLVEASVKVGGEAIGSDRWRMVTDNLSGTLVVTATPSQHREIEDLIDRLELTAGGARKPIRSFPIKNRGVEEMHGLLQGLLDAGALEGEPAKTQPAPAQPQQGVTAPIPTSAPRTIASDELGGEMILTVDKPTNRLIAMGEARMLEQLGALIQELDVRHPQVLVEAMVVSLTDNQTQSLGIELQKIGNENDVLYRLSSLFGLGSPDPASSTLPAPGGTGFGGVVLDPGDFSAVVRALETINKGRTLTMPKMLVNNNQPAELNSVLQTPFASTNASTTVATTSFGGTQDAGTQISVTPQIADGDQLVLDYTISISAFVGSPPSPELPPPRQENKLKSVVTIPDGFTVVVGGLEIGQESEVSSHVPLLGRIPVLGALFSNRTQTDNKSRFFVFLRCTVLREGRFEDLKYLSGPELTAARVEDGWPVLQPRVIR